MTVLLGCGAWGPGEWAKAKAEEEAQTFRDSYANCTAKVYKRSIRCDGESLEVWAFIARQEVQGE